MSHSTTLESPDDAVDSAEEIATPLPDEAFVAQGPLTPAQEHKRKRRLDARTWTPDESVAVIWNQIQIGSQMIQKNWNVLFVRAQTTLYMLQHIVPSAGDMETARSLETVMRDRLGELEKAMREETDRLNTLAANDGITKFPAKNYVNPETIDVPIYTPGAQRFLALLCNVDDLIWKLDYLWLQGVIKVEYKFQVMNYWRNKLWELVKFTTSTWLRARTALRAAQKAQSARERARREARAAKLAGDTNGSDASSSTEAVDGGDAVADMADAPA